MARPKATHHAVFIVAHIHGPEVADMLRYDNCCPANEVNAHKLVRAFSRDEGDWIVLKRFVPVGAPKDPNYERWNSFNIICLPKAYESFDEAEVAAQKVAAPSAK